MHLVECAVESLDAWRTAHSLVEIYGTEARLISLKRAITFLQDKDIDAYREWEAVVKTIVRIESRSILTSG